MNKKIIALVLGIFALVLTGCWNKGENNNVNEEIEKNDTLEDLVYKIPLTLEDLERINDKKFPVSYEYSVYSGITFVETGEYRYGKDIDYKLLPIDDKIVEKEVTNSEMKNSVVYTTVNVLLDNGEMYIITYLTDPKTLNYLAATLTIPAGGSILYKFKY